MDKQKKELKLELDVFEGPLDLLLHLINKFEIDIYDIPILEITEQYMHYLKEMQNLRIDVASEYFVMAASLMRIKSEMLVPRNENHAEIEEDFYEDEDPRKALMEVLLEYKQIKSVVPKFEERSEERSDYFGKDPSDISKFQETVELKDLGLGINDLADIFTDILKRHHLDTPQPTKIDTEEITVIEQIEKIRAHFIHSERKSVSFSELIEKPTRQTLVVTFLALLEMVKNNQVYAQQDSIESDITISIVENIEKEKLG